MDGYFSTFQTPGTFTQTMELLPEMTGSKPIFRSGGETEDGLPGRHDKLIFLSRWKMAFQAVTWYWRRTRADRLKA